MRQAGRCLPEYRALRARHSLLSLCKTAELAAEVTLQPVRRFEVDAAILFSDLVLPLEPMGIVLAPARGDACEPEQRVQATGDVDRLRVYEPREALAGVLDAVRIACGQLDGHRPVLGFAGAPFTLACHAVEGGNGAGFTRTRSLMYGNPACWHRLCEKLATVAADFLRAQVEAGAQALQLFDSWVGALSPGDYRQYAFPHTRRVFDALSDLEVPIIHFGVGAGHLLELMRAAGGHVIGVDSRIPLDEAWDRIGLDRGIQGNLDPALLLGPVDRLLAGAAEVLERAAGRPGHVFNLGHGLLGSTPVARIQALTRYIHAHAVQESR
jgi:uroporphyrinogen decarboxylase